MKTATEHLARKISSVAGFEIELTVRGEKSFTFSAEGDRDFGRVANFFGQAVRSNTVYDDECDLTCFYVDVR